MKNTSARVVVVVASILAVLVAAAPAQELEVLASFDNPPLAPTGGLVVGPDGSLWGVAGGGAYDYGAVFRYEPAAAAPAELTTVFSFPDPVPGGGAGRPTQGLVLADDGNFYGLQSDRGAVYRLTPAGEYELLRVVGADGSCSYPDGALAFLDGALYGTCRSGGDPALPPDRRQGVVFRVGLDGSLSLLHTFTGGAAGRTPEAGLTAGPDGRLYGTTLYGGANDAGTIFGLDPASGVVELLHHFNRPVDGSGPTGELTLGPDGALYGAATYGDNGFVGCGTVFRFDPAAASDRFSVLHAFSCAKGETKHPTGGMLVVDGSLYGITYGDTTDWRAGDGAVFRIELAGAAFETLRSHSAEKALDGALVLGPDGFIYSQGRSGGSSAVDLGEIFRVDPESGAVETVHRFGAGAAPRRLYSLVEGEPGELLVVTREGGPTNRGLIFRRAADGELSVLHAFADGSAGTWGMGAFLTRGSDGLFYGTRANGGTFAKGSVFQLDREGTYTELHSFDGSYPWYDSVPRGALIESRFDPGLFYGTLGGGGSDGGVYSIDAAGGYTLLGIFTSEQGSPRGRLLQTADGWLYGAVAEWFNITGGYTEYGAVFRASPGGGLARLEKIQEIGGQRPEAGLTLRGAESGDESFYGTTSYGGDRGNGMVFKRRASGGLAAVHRFQGTDGSLPLAELTLAGDGRLYGSTRQGGAHGYGTLFAVDGSDGLETVHHFDHATGAWPESAMILGADGNLYGVATGGGPGGGGVLFRYNLAPVLTLGGPSAVDEGGAITLAASAVDPQGGAVSFVWDLDDDGDFDDGSGPSVVLDAGALGLDGPATHPVAVRAVDASGIATVAEAEVEVRNLAPVVSIAPTGIGAVVGREVVIEVSFLDPGPDTWAATVDWGDGAVETFDPVTSPFTLRHSYAAAGSYRLTVRVADDDGGEGEASRLMSVGTARSEIQALIGDIEDLIDDGEISYSRGRNLMAELQVALWFLQFRNGERIAIQRLDLFIIKVRNYVATGVLDPALGDELIAKAREIIALLR